MPLSFYFSSYVYSYLNIYFYPDNICIITVCNHQVIIDD